MLVYKALYRKMMDALKDSDMWLTWADKLKEKHPTVAKFLCDGAKSRVEVEFPKTFELFKNLCHSEKSDDHECLSEMVEEHILEWHESLMSRIKKW